MEITRTQRVPAPADRVYHSLIDAGALVWWFCDTATVDAREGGIYEFGGPHAYGGHARGRIVGLEPGRSLTFTWPLAGVETTVAIELREVSPHETDLVVTHTGVTALPLGAEWPREHLGVVWLVLLRQLASLLGGRPVPRYDFTVAPPPVVDLEIAIAAPVSRVWEMLTAPAQMNRWIAKDAAVDLRVGGLYTYGWPEDEEVFGPREIVALDPPRVLAFSWLSQDLMGTVTWTLQAVEGGTRVRLTHEGLIRKPGVLGDYTIGWWEFLTKLRWVLEGEPSPVA